MVGPKIGRYRGSSQMPFCQILYARNRHASLRYRISVYRMVTVSKYLLFYHSTYTEIICRKIGSFFPGSKECDKIHTGALTTPSDASLLCRLICRHSNWLLPFMGHGCLLRALVCSTSSNSQRTISANDMLSPIKCVSSSVWNHWSTASSTYFQHASSIRLNGEGSSNPYPKNGLTVLRYNCVCTEYGMSRGRNFTFFSNAHLAFALREFHMEGVWGYLGIYHRDTLRSQRVRYIFWTIVSRWIWHQVWCNIISHGWNLSFVFEALHVKAIYAMWM